jgi:hypothetical protein
MKKLMITMMLFPLLGFTQIIENLDDISPFHNEVAAVKKGDKWAFIDKEGQIVVEFRDDLVPSDNDNSTYPVFNNERSLITAEKNGIPYFGYIDKSGKTVIKPEFLNATNFKDGVALAIVVEKEIVGYNDIFNKPVAYYHYFEVVIDTAGKATQYLTQLAVHVAPSNKKNHQAPPTITSKLLSNNTVAVKENNKWTIKKIN